MKKVMKRAVELAREMTGDWVARMALALKQAWKEVKEAVENMKDVVIEAKANEWANYGKERLYIDVNIALVELKVVNGNTIGAKRGLSQKGYYDWKEEKLMVYPAREKDLSSAADEIVTFLKDELNKKFNEQIEKFRARRTK